MEWLVKLGQWIIENFDAVMKIGIPVVAFFIVVSMVPDITARIRKIKLALKEALTTPLGFFVLAACMIAFYYIYEWYQGALI